MIVLCLRVNNNISDPLMLKVKLENISNFDNRRYYHLTLQDKYTLIVFS